jgi:hypothetical protein
MNRRSVMMCVLAMLLPLPGATALRGADDVLRAIPDGTLAFAVVNRLAETDAKVQKLAGQLNLPVAGVLAHLKDSAGIKEGLDEKRPAASVLMAPAKADGLPVVMLMVPVTDYALFLKQLKPEEAAGKLSKVTVFGGPFLIGRRGSYAVLAEQGQEELLARVLDSQKSAADELASLQPWLDTNDLAGVVTRKGVEFFGGKAVAGLKKSRDAFGDMPAEAQESIQSVRAIIELYEKVVEGAQKEVALVAAGLRLDQQDNLRLAGRVTFVPGGEAAKLVTTVRPSARNLLAGLPAEPYVVAAAGVVPEGTAEAMMGFSMQIMQSAAPMIGGLQGGDLKKYIEESKDSMKGVRGMSMFLGVGKARDPLYANMLALVDVEDARGYVARYEKSMKAVGELGKGDPKSMFAGMAAEKTKIAETDALKVSMKVPLPPAMEESPELRKMMDEMMEKMYGPGGKIVTYLAVADRHTIVTGFTTPDPAARAIRTIRKGEKGLAADPLMAKTAALLPADAAWVFYWSPAGTMDFAARMIGLMAGPMGGGPTIPAFPASPPVGAALSTAPGELRLEAIVPNDTLKAGGEYARKMLER